MSHLKQFHISFAPALDDDMSQVVWAVDADAAVKLWLTDGLGSGLDYACVRLSGTASLSDGDVLGVHELPTAPTDPNGNVVLWHGGYFYAVHSKEDLVTA